MTRFPVRRNVFPAFSTTMPSKIMRRLLLVFIFILGTSFEVQARSPAPASTSEAQQEAIGALETLLSAYAEGNIAKAEGQIDPAMIGFQVLVEAMKTSVAQQKQIRVWLRDTNSLAGDGIVVIKTGWEKRFLSGPSLTPALRSGKANFMFRKSQDGWRLIGASGNNVFGP